MHDALPPETPPTALDILTLRIDKTRPQETYNPNVVAFDFEWFYFGEQPVRRAFLARCTPIDEVPVLRDLLAEYDALVHKIERVADDELMGQLFASNGTGAQGELVDIDKDERKLRDSRLKTMLSDLQGLTLKLTDCLVPDEIQTEMAKLVEDTPVLLITGEQYIPWELMRISLSEFLPLWGTNFALGRLLLASEPTDTRPLDLINPRILYINPLSVQPEPSVGSWLRGGVGPDDPGFMAHPVQLLTRGQATYQKIATCLQTGDYDLIYYQGHVKIGEEGQARLVVYDEPSTDSRDDQRLIDMSAVSIKDCGHRRRKRRREGPSSTPLVILNACQTAALVRETEVDEEEPTLGRLSSYDGLAKAFLDFGACAVIATLWPVVFGHSQSFCEYLSECLRVQQYSTIGSVLRVTKGRFREKHQDLVYKDFHFLPYILYGPPSMVEPLRTRDMVRFSYWGEQFRFLFHHLSTQQALSILPRGLRVETVAAGYDIVDVVFREYAEGDYELPFVVVAPVLSVAKAHLEGMPIRIVGVLFQPAREGSAVVLTRDPEVQKVTDLEGRRIGVTRWGMTTMCLKYCLKKAGLRSIDRVIPGYDAPPGTKGGGKLAKKTVGLYNLPQRCLAAALQHGFLDAILLFWPVMHDKDLTLNTVPIMDPAKEFWDDNPDISLPVAVLATHEDFLQAPDTRTAITSTLDTIARSHSWVEHHSEQIVAEQAELYGVPETVAKRLFDIDLYKECYLKDDEAIESFLRIWSEAANLQMLSRSLSREEVKTIVRTRESLF